MPENVVNHPPVELGSGTLTHHKSLPSVDRLELVIEGYGIGLIPDDSTDCDEFVIGQAFNVFTDLCLGAEGDCPSSDLRQDGFPTNLMVRRADPTPRNSPWA